MPQLLSLPLGVYLALWILYRAKPIKSTLFQQDLLQYAADYARMADVLKALVMAAPPKNWIERMVRDYVSAYLDRLYGDYQAAQALSNIGTSIIGYIAFKE
jgi:hypothetical protein